MSDIDRTKLTETIRMISDAMEKADAAGIPLVAAHLSTALDCARLILAGMSA